MIDCLFVCDYLNARITQIADDFIICFGLEDMVICLFSFFGNGLGWDGWVLEIF